MSLHRYNKHRSPSSRKNKSKKSSKSPAHSHYSRENRSDHGLKDTPNKPSSARSATRYHKSSSRHKQSAKHRDQHYAKNRSSKSKHRSKYKSSSSSRRRQRDIMNQYKLYALREIIEKITTDRDSKSSVFTRNTAKMTLITYYQTNATAQEFMDELEHRFFSVLPVEEEDKSSRPYISDTDSVSERHCKTKPDDHNLVTTNHPEMDQHKAYGIQLRVIGLLEKWMKEYFMEDFEESNLIQQLKHFIQKIKNLKTRQIEKLPSIPYDDDDKDILNNEIPDLPENGNPWKKMIEDNKYSDVVIKTTPKIATTSNHNTSNDGVSAVNPMTFGNQSKIQSYHYKKHGGYMSSNPLHPSNSAAVGGPSTDSYNSEAMKTEQMEQITTRISPIHSQFNIVDHEPLHLEQPTQTITTPKIIAPKKGIIDEEKKMAKIIKLEPTNNALFIPSNELCFTYNRYDHYFVNLTNESSSCVVINSNIDNDERKQQQKETQKVMIRNISDYNDMRYNGYGQKQVITPNNNPKLLQLHENQNKFKPNKTSEDSDCKRDDSNHRNKEVTENVVSTPMTSSDDRRETSVTSFRNEDSRISADDPLLSQQPADNDNNNNNNIEPAVKPKYLYVQQDESRRYYVCDPIKYKGFADKIEKTLYKQKKEAPFSTGFIQRRPNQKRGSTSYLLHSNNRETSVSTITSLAQLGSSLSGSKIMGALFYEEIIPLKEDFQNNVKNEDIAQQITLMTFKAFKRVRKREFIDQAWKCKDRLELAGNLCQLIDHFNCISRWVQITILHCKDVKKRGRMIKKFIKIMDILLSLNNFQSLCAVYGAITSSSIYTLDSAWNHVPPKHKHRFEEIKHYFVTANNMANLRALHRERQPPMIPYTGIYLQDLIQTEERFKEKMIREQMKATSNANNNHKDNNNSYFTYNFSGAGGVVFDHLTKMSKQIENILVYAKTPYENINDNHIIQKYILSEFADQAKLTDDDIYKISENVAKADGDKQ